MTAPRITAEDIEFAASHWQGMAGEGVTTGVVGLHLLEETKRLRSKLDRLSAQGGEVPEPDVSIIRSQGFTTIWWTSNPCGERNKENLERFLRENPGAVREDLWRRPAPPHPDTVEVSAKALEHELATLFGLLLYTRPTDEAKKLIDALRAQAQPATEREV